MATQSQATLADDDDPRIIYSGEWNVVESWKDPREFGRTAHVTSQQGASATLRFQGDGVRFFMSLPAVTGERNAIVNLVVRLDGESTEVRTFGRGTPAALTAPFVKEGLDPSRVHELVVTYQGQTEFADSLPLRFDGIRWTIPGGQPVNSSSPSAPASPQESAAPPLPPSSSSAISAASPPDFPASVQPPDPSSSPRSAGISSIATGGALVSTDERIVTKILPQDRLTTLTDSTGGITVRTEPAAAPSSSGQLSVGPMVAIVISILTVLALMCLGGILVRRKRRARLAASNSPLPISGDDDLQANPFVAQRSPDSLSLPPTHYPAAYQKERFERQDESAVHSPSEATDFYGQDLAPPVYSYSAHSSVQSR